MSDLSGTIERLGDFQSYTVTRYKVRGMTDGKLDAARVETTLTIKAEIQPASYKDLLRLDEGLRTSEVIVIFTKTQLMVLGEDAQKNETKPPDTIVYKNKTYQIERCEDWERQGNYWEALARKV